MNWNVEKTCLLSELPFTWIWLQENYSIPIPRTSAPNDLLQKKAALVYELFTFYYIGFICVVVIQDPLYCVLLSYLLLNTMEIHDLWDFVSPFKG